jgi:hypothetical protein
MTAQEQTSKEPSNPLILVGVLLLFGLVFGGVGLQRYSVARASSDWPSVQGQITSGRIQTTQRDGKNEYMPTVRYSFTVEGRGYSGSRITASDEYQKNRGSAQDILARYPVGGQVEVFYNPADPGVAVLEKGMPGNVKVLLVTGGLCLAFSVLIGVSALRGRSA